MDVPKEVRHAFAGLHQDVFLIARTREDLVDAATMLLTDETRPVVLRFLVGLLDGTHTRGEIRAAFEKTEADVRFERVDELVDFLSRVKARLQE